MSSESEEIEILSKIITRFQCRNKQIRKLFHYLKMRDAHNIVINGPRATGKSSVTKFLLDEFKLFYVWFDMVNLDHLNRFFYEKILYRISTQIEMNDENSMVLNDNRIIATSNRKYLNHLDFIDGMVSLLESYQRSLNGKNLKVLHQKLIIVLDNADILIDENKENLIYLLNNINQITNGYCPISVVWICKYRLERLFRLSEFKISALEISFDPYTQEELYLLLTHPSLIPKEDPHNLYKNFVNLILKTLIPFENNFLNLKFICYKYFGKYVQPIQDDEIIYNKAGQLYVRFQPQIQEIIDQISGDVINGLNKNVKQYINSLSPSMCYVYISIYLATYNSVKTDIRFFVRNQKSRSRKSLHPTIKDQETKYPKWFELERAYHIYRALVDLNEKDREMRINLLTNQEWQFFRQLADLFDCKILISKCASHWSCAGDAKYQLSQVITDDMILDIASQIDLDINAFVHHRIEPSIH